MTHSLLYMYGFDLDLHVDLISAHEPHQAASLQLAFLGLMDVFD